MQQKPIHIFKNKQADGSTKVTRYFHFLGVECREVTFFVDSQIKDRTWQTTDFNGRIQKFDRLSEMIYFLKNKEQMHLEARRSAEFWKRVDRRGW